MAEQIAFSAKQAQALGHLIEHRRSEDIARLIRGELISLRDIQSCLEILPPGTKFRLLTRWDGTIVPALCLGIKAVQRPRNPKEELKAIRVPSLLRRQSHYAAMLQKRGVKWENSTILLVSNAPPEFEPFRASLQNHIITLIIHTQVWRNLHKDLSAKLRDDIPREFLNVEAVIDRATSRIGCRYAILDEFHYRNRESGSPEIRVQKGFRLSRTHPNDADDWSQFLKSSDQKRRRFDDAAREAISTAKVIDLSGADWLVGDNLSEVRSCLIFPVARSTDTRSLRSQVVILYSNPDDTSMRFKSSDIALVQDLIGIFLNQQGQERRAKCLQDLAQASRKIEAVNDLEANHFLENAYVPALKSLCGDLLVVTQAHSATIRLIDHGTQTLRPVAFDQANASSGNSPWQEPRPISLRRRFSSSIVFAYYNDAIYPYGIYLKNVRMIPKDLRERGLTSVIINKEETSSSIQIPFHLNRVPIGILNLESRFLSAFDDAIGFLANVAQLISLLLTELQARYDAQFVADRVSYLGHVHDLENLQKRLALKDEDLAARLREIVGFMRNDDDPLASECDEISLSSILNEAAALRATFGSEVLDGALLSFSIEDQGLRIVSSQRMKRALRFIVDNYLSNIIRHRHRSSASCKITLVDSRQNGETELSHNGVLGIDYVIRKKLSDRVAKSLGARPIVDSERGLRLGLYTVGLVTRILGGYTTSSLVEDVTVMAVRIPVRIGGEEGSING